MLDGALAWPVAPLQPGHPKMAHAHRRYGYAFHRSLTSFRLQQKPSTKNHIVDVPGPWFPHWESYVSGTAGLLGLIRRVIVFR